MKTKPCSNPECIKSFDLKNPKKRFCSLLCKNKTAYLYNQKIYVWEIKQFKARRKNIQILEYLMIQKKTIVPLSELKTLGFDTQASYIHFTDENDIQIYRYGNVGLKTVSKTEYELFKM